jgi:hypothetical protein
LNYDLITSTRVSFFIEPKDIESEELPKEQIVFRLKFKTKITSHQNWVGLLDIF